MTRSSVFFFTVSLLLLLVAASATASAGNVTSGLRYEGCVPGDTVGECIAAAVEEDGVEEVVRRILKGQNYVSYDRLQGQAPLDCKIAGNCIGIVNVGTRARACTYFNRCKRYPGP